MKKSTLETNIFFEKMLAYLPQTNQKYEESIKYFGERLDTVIIEEVFMPEITEMIRKNMKTDLLNSIFEYFEEISNSKDEYLVNLFSITVLEILGNEEEILEKAQKYMRFETNKLQIQADLGLGRIR